MADTVVLWEKYLRRFKKRATGINYRRIFKCNFLFRLLICLCDTSVKGSTGASLNEPIPPNYNNWPLIFWRPFLVVTLQNNNRHTSARAQKIFPIRNMRPLNVSPPPRPGIRGSFHRLWLKALIYPNFRKLG